MPLRICAKARAVHDRQAGRESGERGRVWPAKEVADEQGVPGELSEDAHLQPLRGVGASKEILHEHVARLHVREEISLESGELRRRHRFVVVPPDRALGLGVANGEFVLRRAAGVGARLDRERAAGRDVPLAPPDGLLIKLGLLGIAVDALWRRKGKRLFAHFIRSLRLSVRIIRCRRGLGHCTGRELGKLEVSYTTNVLRRREIPVQRSHAAVSGRIASPTVD